MTVFNGHDDLSIERARRIVDCVPKGQSTADIYASPSLLFDVPVHPVSRSPTSLSESKGTELTFSNDPKAQRSPLSKTQQRRQIHQQSPDRVDHQPLLHLLLVRLLDRALRLRTAQVLLDGAGYVSAHHVLQNHPAHARNTASQDQT